MDYYNSVKHIPEIKAAFDKRLRHYINSFVYMVPKILSGGRKHGKIDRTYNG